MDSVATFATLAADPYTDWPAHFPGHRAIGYLCTYVPEEIIHAAGFTPIRIMPGREAPTRADAHLQSYTCHLARSCLHQALSGDLDFLAGIVFAHTCDTMQCLANVWTEGWQGQDRFVQTVVLPTVLSSPHAKAYLVAELRHFAHRLEEHFGTPITEEALRQSIALYNRTRHLLAQVYEQRDTLSAVNVWHIVNATMLVPKSKIQIPNSKIRDEPSLSSPTHGWGAPGSLSDRSALARSGNFAPAQG